MPKDLSAFFSPRSIAVIGVSRTAEKVGAIVLKNIINSGFRGQIYPVNPNATDINNLKCYPDVVSLPETPDLAVIAIPASGVIENLNQIGEKGIKNAVVFAAGFRETGEAGAKLEKDLSELANKYGINLLGPNCLGFVNNLCPVNATFGQLVNQPGNLRFISQSGAIAASIFDWCRSIGLGFCEFVTLGNKAVINENDILQYFLDHPQIVPSDTQGLSNVFPIGLYLESISNGTDFLRITGEISKKNPIFIIKPGKTKEAAKAMQSHTGAIAGEDQVLEAVLQQAGIVRCKTLEDFFDLSRAFAWENVPVGPKVAIISNAGGPAVISADAVVGEGLELAQLDDSTKEKLKNILPTSASLFNPVDVLGDALADRFAQASEVILQTENAHALLVILTPQLMTQIEKTAEFIGGLSKKYQKPIFCSFIGGSMVSEGEQKLNEYRIPSFRFPERAIAAIGAMWRWKREKDKKEKTGEVQTLIMQPNNDRIREIINNAKTQNQSTLDNVQANDILLSLGIPAPSTSIVSNLEQAKSFAQNCGYPVVLKLSSPGLLHKKKIGGVITDIWDSGYLEGAWSDLEHKIIQLPSETRTHVKIQIQKDVINGMELIVGVKKDPIFGPVLLFGAGGSLAELIGDRNLHLLPLDLSAAKEIVENSKIYSLLKGSENEPAHALDKLYDLIVRLGKSIELIPEISEIEINPVILTLNDVWAVDAKVILEQGEAKPVVTPKFHLAYTVEHTVLVGKFHYFVFEVEAPLVFQAGQYISVKVADNRINCYSIAGRVGENRFSLLVDTMPGGVGSKFFENLKVGDKITYLGPFGNFIFKENDGAKHLLFLGTGSGCSPLRSIIEQVLKEKKLNIPVTLYFGLRYTQDIFWQDYFKKLSEDHPNFNIKLVLSRPDQTWQGLTGHITDLVNNDFPDASGVSCYLCGNKIMIEEAINILLARGCPRERIYSEKF